jgi:hypothetical protein
VARAIAAFWSSALGRWLWLMELAHRAAAPLPLLLILCWTPEECNGMRRRDAACTACSVRAAPRADPHPAAVGIATKWIVSWDLTFIRNVFLCAATLAG